MSAEGKAPVTAPRRSRRRLALGAAALVALAALAGGGFAWYRAHTAPPAPPLPDLTDVDPEVAEAVREARQEVLATPRSGRAWGRLGMVLRAHDFGAESVRALEVAERLDPADPRWPYLRGLTLMLTDPAAGIPCLERAARLCRGDPPAPGLRLAEALLEAGRLQEAEAYLTEALRQAPHDRRAHLGMGRLALQRQDWRGALEQLRPCLDDPHARKLAHALSAEASARLGEADRARAAQSAAAQLPEDEAWPDPFVLEVLQLRRGLRIRLEHAEGLIRGRRAPEALALLTETAEKYPQSVRAWLVLGELWRQLGRPDRAEQAFRRATEADAQAPEAWFKLGVAQALLGRQREAADSFRRAVRLKPDHADAHFNLAHRLKLLGDRAGAAEEFRATLRCRPDYEAARQALAELEAPPGKAPSAPRPGA